jgi:hypothetical protein
MNTEEIKKVTERFGSAIRALDDMASKSGVACYETFALDSLKILEPYRELVMASRLWSSLGNKIYIMRELALASLNNDDEKLEKYTKELDEINEFIHENFPCEECSDECNQDIKE